MAGSGITADGGGGNDKLDLSIAITGTRVDVSQGSVAFTGNGSSSFESFEEIVGGSSSSLMYGDGSGTMLVGGSGLNYIEGSGDDILKSGTGDTYFAASGGATVISGAGNDYIEASGSTPVTIKFGAGSGHDMLGSYFKLNENWALERQFDTILMEGLSQSDVELLWDFTQTDNVNGSNVSHIRTGEAAIRITSTGETLYLGTVKWFFNEGPLEDWGLLLEEEDPSDGIINDLEEFPLYSFDYDHQDPLYNPTGAPDNDSDPHDNTIDARIFSFDGINKLNLFELFDLTSIVTTALPPEVKAAEDLLERLTTAAGGGLASGTEGSDTLAGTSGNDDMLGGGGNDTLDAGAGDDLIRGGSGNDVIIAGPGNDNIDGGSGKDILDASASTAAISVDLSQGTVSGAGIGTDRVSSIESYIGGSGADQFLGDAAANEFHGGGGDDALQGHAGNDSLDGGDGNDQLNGGDGDDTLTGGSGSDQLNGGSGDDTFVINANSALDTIDGSDGWDTVTADADNVSIAVSAISNVEFINANGHSGVSIVGSSGNDSIDLTGAEILGIESVDGGAGDDAIVGSISDDTIIGGLGDDALDGVDGIDTASYASAAGAVSVNLGIATAQNTVGAGIDILARFENLTGSAFADTLIGDSGDNALSGGDGNDVIEGGAGNDDLIGGLGSDTANYRNAGSAVTVNLATVSAQNTLGAGIDRLSGVENLLGSAFNDILHGSAGANAIDGGAGNDTIQGGAGDDVLTGGAGIDTASYALAASGVTVDFNVTESQNTNGAGNDILADFENLIGSNFNDVLVGDAAANNINGGSGNDLIDGGAGNDVITGGVGTDTVSYASAGSAVTVSLAVISAQNSLGAGIDTIATMENLIGSAYNDTLTGSTGNNVINGGDGNDVISGGSGNDTLTGGFGDDSLSGGSGADIFTYSLGDGDDVILDSSADSSPDETLIFGQGITVADLIFTRSITDADDLIITFQNASGSIVLDEQYRTDAGIEIFRFSDGTTMTESEAYALADDGGAFLAMSVMADPDVDLSGLPSNLEGLGPLQPLSHFPAALGHAGLPDLGLALHNIAIPLAADAMPH